MRNLSATIDWTTNAKACFIRLKQALSSAADMATPDYKRPFFLDVSAKTHSVSAVLYQKKGDGTRAVCSVAQHKWTTMKNVIHLAQHLPQLQAESFSKQLMWFYITP